MATVSTPLRQPFGVLNESKLRSLQSVKNRQNAIAHSPAQSLKRRALSPENSDSENINPFVVDLSSKRKRAAFDDDISLAKKPCLQTRVIPSATTTYTPPASIRQAETTKTGVTPLSAPPAAGRSPTRPHNRHDKLAPKRRFAQPSLKVSSPSISIAAALRGTIAHKRPAKTRKSVTILEEAKPQSWFFDIFEEPEEQQDYRMSEWTMTQSSAALEISDDERKGYCFESREDADKGKENIDPNDMAVSSRPVTRSAAVVTVATTNVSEQKDTEDQEPRTPLGNLNAAEFYAEGLDATSVILVHDDDASEEAPVPVQTPEENESTPSTESANPPLAASNDFTFVVPLEYQDITQPDLTHEPIPEWALQASASSSHKALQRDDAFIFCDETADLEPADIEVWESESAKDENDNYDQENPSGCIVVGEGQSISLSGGAGICLQEI